MDDTKEYIVILLYLNSPISSLITMNYRFYTSKHYSSGQKNKNHSFKALFIPCHYGFIIILYMLVIQLHLPASFKGLAQGHLICVLEVTTYRDTMGNTCNLYAQGL